jgi:hypothetical protein
MNTHRKRRVIVSVGIALLVLVGTVPWRAVAGGVGSTFDGASLEGIWTTMTPTPAGRLAILSLVITAQGSEGMVYTCVGKHPECSVTAYGLSPEAEKVSDLLGHFVRTGANTFDFSVVCQGIKRAGPELLDIGETLYMVVLAGNAELVDSETMIIHEFTYAAYTPAQDLDGDRLPDEGTVPVVCAAMPQLPFKRLPVFAACEPTPSP